MPGPPTRDGYRNRMVFERPPEGGLAKQVMRKKPARVPYQEMRDLNVQRALSRALRKQE